MIHEATFSSLRSPRVKDISLSQFRHYLWLSPALFAIHDVIDAPRLAEWIRSVQGNYCYFRRKMAAVLLIAAVLLYDPVLRLAFKVGSAVVHEQHRRDSSPDHALGAGNVV